MERAYQEVAVQFAITLVCLKSFWYSYRIHSRYHPFILSAFIICDLGFVAVWLSAIFGPLEREAAGPALVLMACSRQCLHTFGETVGDDYWFCMSVCGLPFLLADIEFGNSWLSLIGINLYLTFMTIFFGLETIRHDRWRVLNAAQHVSVVATLDIVFFTWRDAFWLFATAAFTAGLLGLPRLERTKPRLGRINTLGNTNRLSRLTTRSNHQGMWCRGLPMAGSTVEDDKIPLTRAETPTRTPQYHSEDTAYESPSSTCPTQAWVRSQARTSPANPMAHFQGDLGGRTFDFPNVPSPLLRRGDSASGLPPAFPPPQPPAFARSNWRQPRPFYYSPANAVTDTSST
ncbi:hypothetical protein QBC46DRAFT_351026 [Diplogelasinospora grovesii]|uniref:Uncharacterized protein n=1 Tax=Diplogelasinospora grovesii TaxID=303347 RepID=A0AAN6S856_9PEZI|nr:hypothetical protein QBC46DRAFT_351026 [Diplogelasinospora grovesii]